MRQQKSDWEQMLIKTKLKPRSTVLYPKKDFIPVQSAATDPSVLLPSSEVFNLMSPTCVKSCFYLLFKKLGLFFME